MRLHRLAFLPRLMRWAPEYSLRLSDATPRHKGTYILDLVWLASHSSKFADIPEPHLDVAAWLDVCRLRSSCWKQVLQDPRAQLLV